MHNKEWSKVIVRVEPELHREFKAATARQGIPMCEVVIDAIDAYLRSRKAPQALGNSAEA